MKFIASILLALALFFSPAGAATPYECNVTDHGAVGNGTTDDYAAFEACRVIVEGFASSGIIVVPPSNAPYCVKSTLTLQKAGTQVIGSGSMSALCTCGEDKTLIYMAKGMEYDIRDSSAQGGQRISGLRLLGKGACSGSSGIGATASVVVAGPLCAECVLDHLYVYGGAHAIEINAGEIRMFNIVTCCSYGSSTVWFVGRAESGQPYAGGQVRHLTPDQNNYPYGTPPQASTYTDRIPSFNYITVGSVVKVTCQDGKKYHMQLRVAGQSSAATTLTCSNYNVDTIDNTARWVLIFPDPYYHVQIDTGSNQVDIYQSDTGGGTAGFAMTNTLGGMPPTTIRCNNCNGGNGYLANFLIDSGNGVSFIGTQTGGCLSPGCYNYRFGDAFTGDARIQGGFCDSSPRCLRMVGPEWFVTEVYMRQNTLAGIVVTASAGQMTIMGNHITNSPVGIDFQPATPPQDWYTIIGNICPGTATCVNGGLGAHSSVSGNN